MSTKLKILLFAAGVSIVAGGVVGAQVIFPDGTEQSTAFTGRAAVPVGDSFSIVFITGSGGPSIQVVSATVPSGQELVILQTRFGLGATLHYTLESRLPTPNENTLPLLLALVNQDPVADFPDGVVVIDEGRQLWVQQRDDFGDPVGAGFSKVAISFLGYYRNKS